MIRNRLRVRKLSLIDQDIGLQLRFGAILTTGGHCAWVRIVVAVTVGVRAGGRVGVRVRVRVMVGRPILYDHPEIGQSAEHWRHMNAGAAWTFGGRSTGVEGKVCGRPRRRWR